ncbi:MAG: rRNA maturation RNase YbeY [Omnitrophica bacterium]|nr:rRNA maturation RNase YbeY [Candidatus Omnitrophota bacterium]
MKIRVEIKDRQRKIAINKKAARALVRRVLKLKGLTKAEVSILFAGKTYIRTLNRRFRKIDEPTDVLAFSMYEGRENPLHPEVLGDLVICPEIAQKYARSYGTSLNREIYLYLIHGILHLLGYDDTSAKKRIIMEKEQNRILKKILKR